MKTKEIVPRCVICPEGSNDYVVFAKGKRVKCYRCYGCGHRIEIWER